MMVHLLLVVVVVKGKTLSVSFMLWYQQAPRWELFIPSAVPIDVAVRRCNVWRNKLTKETKKNCLKNYSSLKKWNTISFETSSLLCSSFFSKKLWRNKELFSSTRRCCHLYCKFVWNEFSTFSLRSFSKIDLRK